MKSKTIIAAVVAVAMLASMSVFAIADQAVYDVSGTATVASGDVTARANIRPILVLTINTPDAGQMVDFGDVDPEDMDDQDVTLNVRSNRVFDLTKSVAGQDAAMGLTTSLANQLDQPRGANNNYTDTYSIDVPWNTEPGVYTATITYTATQK